MSSKVPNHQNHLYLDPKFKLIAKFKSLNDFEKICSTPLMNNLAFHWFRIHSYHLDLSSSWPSLKEILKHQYNFEATRFNWRTARE